MVAGVLLFSIVIIQLPAAFGEEPPAIVRVASLVPFAAALTALLLRRGDWRIRPLHALLFGVYLVLVTVAIVRAGLAEIYSPAFATLRVLEWLLVAGLGLSAFAREPREHARRRHLAALCWAPVVYVALNVALHVVGFGADRSDFGYLPTALLGQLGISSNRALFPLSTGFNNFGAIAGIALTSSTLLAWRAQGRLRRAAMLGAGVSLYAVLLTDSRAAFIFSLTAIVFVILAPRVRARRLGRIALLLPLVPLLVVEVLATVANGRYSPEFSREGASLATGTVRVEVWEAVLSFLSDFRLEHFFGYGSYGQATSGVSLGYSTFFRGSDDLLTVSPHNMLLQSILDTGYIGLLIILSLCVVIVNRLAAHRVGDPSPQSYALFGAAVCLLLIGLVEAVPAEGGSETFTFWLLALPAALRVPSAAQPRAGPPRRATPRRPIPVARTPPRQHQVARVGARR